MDELLGLAVDSLVVFAQASKWAGLLGAEEDFKEQKEVSHETRKPLANPKPGIATELPEVTGPASSEKVMLTPCPRCDAHDVLAGPMTVQLPDPVCAPCEGELPGGQMEVDDYLRWIQKGSDA